MAGVTVNVYTSGYYRDLRILSLPSPYGSEATYSTETSANLAFNGTSYNGVTGTNLAMPSGIITEYYYRSSSYTSRDYSITGLNMTRGTLNQYVSAHLAERSYYRIFDENTSETSSELQFTQAVFSGDDVINGYTDSSYGTYAYAGYDGNDVINSGNTNDSVWGGNGNDYLFGQLGNDTIYGEQGADTVIGGSGLDYLSGGDDNDYMLGGRGNDTLYGGDGDDQLLAGQENDLCKGGRGNDTILSGTGQDTIMGGDGDDSIEGGNGDDYIIGGAGADIFVYNSGFGSDSIYGFDITNDRIQIRTSINGFSNLGVTQILALAAPDPDTPSNTIINLGNASVGNEDMITLVGINYSALTAANFQFAS